jgi:hypothetical protein
MRPPSKLDPEFLLLWKSGTPHRVGDTDTRDGSVAETLELLQVVFGDEVGAFVLKEAAVHMALFPFVM